MAGYASKTETTYNVEALRFSFTYTSAIILVMKIRCGIISMKQLATRVQMTMM